MYGSTELLCHSIGLPSVTGHLPSVTLITDWLPGECWLLTGQPHYKQLSRELEIIMLFDDKQMVSLSGQRYNNLFLLFVNMEVRVICRYAYFIQVPKSQRGQPS